MGGKSRERARERIVGAELELVLYLAEIACRRRLGSSL
jgi:hypothetical protein